MKFSQSLQYNAVPRWMENYIDYYGLKEIINGLEKTLIVNTRSSSDTLDPDFVENAVQDVAAVFNAKLTNELQRIDKFYTDMEEYLFNQVTSLLDDYDEVSEHYDTINEKARQKSLNEDSDSEDEEQEVGSSLYQRRVPVDMKIIVDDVFVTIKRRIILLYVALSELQSYITLNEEGIRKLLIDFDNKINTNLREEFESEILPATNIYADTCAKGIDTRISALTTIYRRFVPDRTEESAKKELKSRLREETALDRNDIWKDYIDKVEGRDSKLKEDLSEYEEPPLDRTVMSILGDIVIALFLNASFLKTFASTLVFLIMLYSHLLESPEQNRCFSVVIYCSLLWATEALPLFTTSMLVPLLLIGLQIPCYDNGSPMSAVDASKFIFSNMWSSVITLLLGGFTLAAALKKHKVANTCAHSVLSRVGSSPKTVLLAFMGVATFLSMWISNVAAPVLCYSIAEPLLHDLPPKTRFSKAIVLGIALASNVGGIASPVASPQNVIALEVMKASPNWAQWFAVSIPLSIACIFFIWLFLIVSFRPEKDIKIVMPDKTLIEPFNFQQYFICGITFFSILSWCFSSHLEPYFGEMGVLALFPIVVFFGCGVLTSEDFNSFLWTIVALAMGGIVLGKAVASSGLLATIAIGIEAKIGGFSLYEITIFFSVVMLLVSTLISHTVSALILLPIFYSIAEKMKIYNINLVIMTSTFVCSIAMGLPTSGFPNVTAICLSGKEKKPYLSVSNFIICGIPSSAIAYILVITLGFALMKLLNL